MLLFAVLILLPPPMAMDPLAWRVACTAALMAVWWLTEAVPVAITALLPIILFPFLGVATLKQATQPYANPLVFLFMGGFIIALAVERWNLHRRIALNVLNAFGFRPAALVGGFMIATAALSMWVSNTATTVMMLPIGLSVISLLHSEGVSILPRQEDRNLSIALLLGIGYAASVGGLGTLVGTPPNALLAGYMFEVHGRTIGFGKWMLVGIPMVLMLLPIAWFVLTRIAFPVGRQEIPGARASIEREIKQLGPMSVQEKSVAVVFALTALLWVARPLINSILPGLSLSDPAIALFGALALFIIPANLKTGEFLMNWEWAKRLPWAVLILFGGGLSLASAIEGSGLDAWFGMAFAGIDAWPVLAVLAVVISVMVFLTELTSNTATAAVFLPVLGAAAATFGVDAMLFVAPAALAASCAFMMPVATPPNAIVFGSGYITVAQMAKAGLLLNFAAIGLILLIAYTALRWAFLI
ncbi:MAG: DASS family sodium-coupled anion symporter [Rhodospirillales bacterium]|nr:DASS family sodium-coupled anion symporter [Rhodospirillales bacterium]